MLTIRDILNYPNYEEMDEKFLKRTCLTPRSQEAFRMSGVHPLEIVYDKFERY
jgi:hypothetical protein